MSSVITFSTKFPEGHPRQSEPTYFVERILQSLNIGHTDIADELRPILDFERYMHEYRPKHHTIRAGRRWKAGDKFSPRVWSGKPYASKQIIIATDIEVVKTWDIYFDGFSWIMPSASTLVTIGKIANNDGLEVDDFKAWFPKPMKGQIICWGKSICY